MLTLFGPLLYCLSFAVHTESIDKAAYFKVFANGNSKQMTELVDKLEGNKSLDYFAYTGALLMRKAGFVTEAKEKLKLFKEGHKLLEEAISKDKQNPEYRFLRLMIQENAPKILNYKSNITEDASLIKSSYKTFPQEVQQAILDYSKKSKALQPNEF